MNLQRHTAPDRFLEQARSFLERSEAANCLTIGIINGLTTTPSSFFSPPFLASLLQNGEVCGTAVMTPPYNLVLSTIPESGLEVLAAHLVASGDGVPGVYGPCDTAARFAGLWQNLTEDRWTQAMRQRVHEAGRVEPVAMPSGVFRQARATSEEASLLIRWMHGYITDIPALEPERFDAERLLIRGLESGRYYLWCDPEPVSMAAWTGGTWNGARIQNVYTPTELRGRGYATACVAALTRLLLAEGRRSCFLMTDLANPTSNAIYARIGYRPVCDTDMYRRISGE